MKHLKILELFCGTKSVSNAFIEAGHEAYTLDSDPQFKPDICKNILDFEVKDLPKEWQIPNVVWASPPCTCFSVASISSYWENSKPKSYKTFLALAIAKKTIEIIKELGPTFWFIENPRGMLRKQFFIKELQRRTVTYCQYGAGEQKPTDIYTNASGWIPKPVCRPGDKCHATARRGEDRGTESANRSPIKRAIIPYDLAVEIVKVCENGGAVSGLRQKRLI